MENKTTYQDLTCRDVINICDGRQLGKIYNLEIDLCTGMILAIIVPGETKCLGLIKSGDDIVIPYCRVKKFGEDVILVEL